MKKILSLSLLAALLLAGCGSRDQDDTQGGLESMFNSDGTSADESVNPDEVPYSEGPTEIPSDILPQ